MKGVLITGANGYVGSRLVKEYLDQDGYHVFALVRGESINHSTKRMHEALDYWNVAESVVSERVTILKGDVCQENLGLEAGQVEQLQKAVRFVIHAASNTRLNQSLQDARLTNLQGTKHAFAVAKSCPHLERFSFLSSIEVVGDYKGVAYEEFLTDYRRNFLNTYEVSKFEAEEFLRGEIENGAPITVFRLSMVVGEARTGKAFGFQSFYMMIEKMLLRPDYKILPRGCPVDTIPVDILAEGHRKLLEHPAACGEVYHLTQGLDDRVTFFDFLDKVQPIAERKLGTRISRPIFISPAVFDVLSGILARITFGKVRRRIELQRLFLKFMAVDWKFDNQKMRSTLASLGVAVPRFDEFLPRLMDYYFEHRHENRLPF